MDIFGHEQDPAVAANQFVFRLVGLWFNQREIRATVGRRYFDPAFAGGKALFCNEFEAQLLQVEPLTHFQIADENDYVLDRQIGLFAARAKHGPVRPREKGVAGHGRDYNGPDECCECKGCSRHLSAYATDLFEFRSGQGLRSSSWQGGIDGIALATARDGAHPYKTRPRLVLSRWVCAYGLLLAAGAFVIEEIRHINPIWIFLSLISMGFIAFAKEEYRTEFRSVASQ